MGTRREDRRQPPREASHALRPADWTQLRRAGVPPLPETEPCVWRTRGHHALPCPSSSSAESGRAPPAGLVTEGRASCSPRGEEGTGLKKVQSLLQAGPSGHLQAGSRVGGGWPRRPGWWVGEASLGQITRQAVHPPVRTATTKQARDFPGGLVVKNPSAHAGDVGSISGAGRSHTPQGNEACVPRLLSGSTATTGSSRLCSETRAATAVSLCAAAREEPRLPQL